MQHFPRGRTLWKQEVFADSLAHPHHEVSIESRKNSSKQQMQRGNETRLLTFTPSI
jgi:hypothetical protein